MYNRAPASRCTNYNQSSQRRKGTFFPTPSFDARSTFSLHSLWIPYLEWYGRNGPHHAWLHPVDYCSVGRKCHWRMHQPCCGVWPGYVDFHPRFFFHFSASSHKHATSALVLNDWRDQLVYWAGPLTGAGFATVLVLLMEGFHTPILVKKPSL